MAHSKFLSKQVRLFVIVLAGVSMVSLLGCPPLNFKTVPDVVGMDQAAAAAALVAAGLNVGVVTEQNFGASVGEVFDQDPDAGSIVVPHATIDLWVSLGFDSV